MNSIFVFQLLPEDKKDSKIKMINIFKVMLIRKTMCCRRNHCGFDCGFHALKTGKKRKKNKNISARFQFEPKEDKTMQNHIFDLAE